MGETPLSNIESRPDLATKYIKTAKPEQYYVIAGDDDFFRREFIKELLENFLKNDVDETSIETFDFSDKAEAPSVEALIESASTQPFFSPKKFIIAREFSKLLKDDMEKLKAFLPRIPEFTYMVLGTSESGKKVQELGIPARNFINLSATSGADIRAWVNAYLKEQDREIDPEVLEYVIAESNEESSLVRGEIDKMILMAADKKVIDREDFEKTKGTEKGSNIYELTEAISAKDEKKAFTVLEKIYEDSSPEMIMAFIFNEIKKMYVFRYFLSTGNVNKAFKFSFVKDSNETIRRAKAFAKVPYVDILAIIMETDKQIKLSGREKAKTLLYMMIQKIFLRLEGKAV
jgi:DNA polymerase-3 subunit delta